MKKPKAILFDWDNTLADTWPVIHDSLTKTFEHIGREPWTFEQTKERVHRSLRDSFPEVFGDDWQEASEVYIKNFKQNHLKTLKMIEGAEEVLQLLHPTDIYMAVVSNKTGGSLRDEVNHIGWNKYFSKVVGAKDAKADKPSPEPVIMALGDSGIELGEDIWLIGDSLTDMQCAHNCNCVPIFYGDQDLSSKRFADYQPAKHFKDHSELADAIKNIV